ncbi:MAG: hypothetical protein HKN14_09595 [Marinicaulis sp.]|nr:hypothetical protein [Marinicaulis sp.]
MARRHGTATTDIGDPEPDIISHFPAVTTAAATDIGIGIMIAATVIAMAIGAVVTETAMDAEGAISAAEAEAEATEMAVAEERRRQRGNRAQARRQGLRRLRVLPRRRETIRRQERRAPRISRMAT